MIWVFVAVGVLLTIIGVFSARGSYPNPNANEPDVVASEDADLDPESDTGEPDGWN